MTLKIPLFVTSILLAFVTYMAPSAVYAQAVEVGDENQVVPAQPVAPKGTGKERAGKYFQERQPTKPVSSVGGPAPRYLAIQVGRMFADSAYNWGVKSEKGVGGFNGGVTYRMGEWVNSMDLNLRLEYTSYSVHKDVDREESARKLSIGGLVTFPDANSRFPLYFGAGAGLGVFVKQMQSESSLVVDYQMVAGARFLDVFDNVGIVVESGIKNHLVVDFTHQYNGVFVNAGAVFAF